MHELGHVFGIGTATSWSRYVSGAEFTGPDAEAVNGGSSVALEADGKHWQDGLTSTLPGTIAIQEVSMDPTIASGVRKNFTDLDFAALQDIGWQVTPVPEPYQLAEVSSLMLIGFALIRRCSRRDTK